MSDDQQTPVAAESTSQAGAASQAQANPTIVNNNNIIIQQPHGSAGAGRRRATARREAAAPRADTSETHANPTPVASTPSRNRAPAAPLAATRRDEFDADGDRVITLSDNLGGTVRIHYDDGVVRTTFNDRQGLLMTNNGEGGFRQYETQNYTEAGEPRRRFVRNSATDGIDGLYGFRPGVQCEGRSNVAATGAVVDSVTRNEVQEYLRRHPSIRDQLSQMNATIVNLNDQPATTREVLSSQPNFVACPADRTDLTVQRLR